VKTNTLFPVIISVFLSSLSQAFYSYGKLCPV
jgi:hypothetical protein